jgi:hypothetical protein
LISYLQKSRISLKFFHFILKGLLFLAIIGTQLFVLFNETGLLSVINNTLVICQSTNILSGDIFFTCNLRGVIFECVDCRGTKELLPKISTLIRSYGDSLFFDVGDFTSFNTNDLVSAFYQRMLERMHVSAINLTKRDFPNILRNDALKTLPFVSSNIKERGIIFDRYKKVGLRLSNRTESKIYEFIIVGLTDDNRYGNTKRHVEVESELTSLGGSLNSLRGNIILLYHNSEYELKKLLERYKGPPLLFAIGCSNDTETNRIKYFNNVPYIFMGGGSKSVGHLRILVYRGSILFSYNLINSILHDDICIRNLMDLLSSQLPKQG